MSCQSVKCRNIGSGYVKGPSAGTPELDAKLRELSDARAQQDIKYFPAITPAAPEDRGESKTNSASQKERR
jgi:hypothetical protein